MERGAGAGLNTLITRHRWNYSDNHKHERQRKQNRQQTEHNPRFKISTNKILTELMSEILQWAVAKLKFLAFQSEKDFQQSRRRITSSHWWMTSTQPAGVNITGRLCQVMTQTAFFHAGLQTHCRDRNKIICGKFHILSFHIYYSEMKEMEKSNGRLEVNEAVDEAIVRAVGTRRWGSRRITHKTFRSFSNKLGSN